MKRGISTRFKTLPTLIGNGFVVTVLLGAATIATAAPTESDVLKALAGSVDSQYQNLEKRSSTLVETTRNLCTEKSDASLEEARVSWQEAFQTYKEGLTFYFSEDDKVKLNYFIGNWPVEGVIMDGIAESSELAYMRKERTNRGFAGLEYLLFTPQEPPLVTTPARCEFLIDLSSEIQRLSKSAAQQWHTQDRTQFIHAGDGNPYLLEGDGLSLAYTQILNIAERVLWDKIGVPTGFFGQEPVRSNQIEALPSGESINVFTYNIRSISKLLHAGGENSLLNLIATRDGVYSKKNPQLAAHIDKQLVEIESLIQKIKSMDGGVKEAVETEKIKPLYEAIQLLQDQLIDGALVLELDVRSFNEKHID